MSPKHRRMRRVLARFRSPGTPSWPSGVRSSSASARRVRHDSGTSMAGGFEGIKGPKEVEVLAYPTRQSNGTMARASGARPSISRSAESTSSWGSEATDGTPSEVRLRKEWPTRDDPHGLLLSTRSGSFRQRSSLRSNGFASGTSTRFHQPLASEGEGSVFPVDMPLGERRRLEEEIIKRFDRLEINSHVGEFWFMIDAGWMTDWVNFIVGKAPPPGPISNYNLFRLKMVGSAARRESMMVQHAALARSRSGNMAGRPDLAIKQGLQKIRDYRALHPMVWYILREIYMTDDAPDVCRWKPDLYSDQVAANRKLRVESTTLPKASYELRRFCAKVRESSPRALARASQ